MAGEFPRAFIVCKEGKQSAGTAAEIFKFIDEKVSAHKRLKGGICFVDEIPKNPSGMNYVKCIGQKSANTPYTTIDFLNAGKILRRVLRDDPAKGLIPYPADTTRTPSARL